jgi:pantoate--beta-alanine ligase
MQTVQTIAELQAARAELPTPVGLVPTMGYLHDGHVALVRRARAECASVVVSIFVNPTQFGPHEDLASYPRDLDGDLAKLEAEKVDLVWMPTPDIMYPAGFQTWVTVDEVAAPLEGSVRPGHFRGVTTVVAKLFNGVLPQKAYFGQKDAQQAVVIRQMAHDLNFPITIVVCPTVREADGLAMSSRNAYLSPEQRRAAAVLYRALRAAEGAFRQGSRDAEALRQTMREALDAEALATPQYVSCADPDTLVELQGEARRALLSLAVFIGTIRLIDNVVVAADRA